MKLTTIKSVVAAALIAVGMTVVAAEPEAVQLWEGGPYFATCNVGATTPEGYGELYTFDNDKAKDAAESLGEGWRLPTKAEFEALTSKCTGQWTTQNGIKGYLFTGKDDYSSKSIFLPAAGRDIGDGRKDDGDEGCYRSSTAGASNYAWVLCFSEEYADVFGTVRSHGLSVRAVRDTPPVTGPTVKVDGVTAGEPWSKITVNYTLSGTDAETYYKVAFDVTAGGQTAGVTNSVAKLTDGAATKELDTTALFGKQVTDTKAKVKVSLIAKNLGGVQLWAGGPIFAKCNIGANVPEEYGYYFWWGDTVGYVRNGSSWDAVDGSKTGFEFSRGNCPTCYKDVTTLKSDGWIGEDGNLVAEYDAATVHLGAPWRMMTDAELQNLTNEVYCTRTWVTSYNGKSVNGYVVKGAQDPYKNNEVFFPAAGCGAGSNLNWEGGLCRYWTSTPDSDNSLSAWGIYFNSSSFRRSEDVRSGGFSVRPVR